MRRFPVPARDFFSPFVHCKKFYLIVSCVFVAHEAINPEFEERPYFIGPCLSYGGLTNGKIELFWIGYKTFDFSLAYSQTEWLNLLE